MEYRPLLPQPRVARPSSASSRLGLLGWLLQSNGLMLAAGIGLALLMPYALLDPLLTLLAPIQDDQRVFGPGMLVIALGIAAAHMSLHNMGFLPLVSSRRLILPSFLVAGGGGLLVMYIFKIPSPKYLVFAGFVTAMAWYYAISILRGRYLRPMIGLLGVKTHTLGAMPGNVEWRILTEPIRDPELAAIVVDPHASLDLVHAQFITQLVLEGVPVYHRAQFEEGITGRVRFASQADNNFGALLPSLPYRRFKRLFDFVAAVLALPFVALAIAVAAVLIKLDSPGSVIFRQTRMGFRGQLFECYKLRTMRSDEDGPAFTRPGDSRVTKIGRILRKWRIDELPQIINVLKGEMSWIGPRPEVATLAERYAEHVPFYDYRHAMRPGISGWAAVHQGNVAELDAAQIKLEYDFYYIRYFSIWLDFLIILKTIQTIWSGFGSR